MSKFRLRRSALLSAAVVLGLALPGASAAAPTWLSPVDLTAGADGTDPAVGVDAAGNVTAVWSKVIPGPLVSDVVVEAAYRSAGATWSAPQPLSSGGGFRSSAEGRNPQVAVNAAGDAVAVWEWRDSAAADPRWLIQASIRPAATGIWSDAVTLSQGGRDAHDPQVSLDDGGNAAAVWRRFDGSNIRIQGVLRPAGGAWSAPTDLSAPGVNGERPQIARLAHAPFFNGHEVAIAVWQSWNGSTTYNVGVACYCVINGGWGPFETFFSSSAPQVVLLPSGNVLVVLQALESTGVEIVARVHGSTGWSSETLSAPGEQIDPFDNKPQVAIDPAGNVVAVWTRRDATDPNKHIVRAAVRSATSGTWSAPVDISAAGGSAHDPQVTLNAAGNALAVWELGGVGSSELVVQAAVRSAGVWDAPRDLSAPGGNVAPFSGKPQAALDSAGNAAAVWQRHNGTSWVVQTAGYDAAGPALRDVSVPTTGTAGTPLAFSVSPFDVWSALGTSRWSFGDGGSAEGTSVSYTYGAAGSYTVTLTQDDAVGNATTTSRSVSIAAAPPAPTPPPPSPPPPPAARDTKGPALSARALARGNERIRITRNGRFALFCGLYDEPVTGTCGGQSLRPASAGARPRKKIVRLGTGSFRATPGRRVRVGFRLSRTDIVRLQRAKRLSMRGTVVARDQLGNATAVRFTFTLLAPRSRRG